jgi:hypothetical protein
MSFVLTLAKCRSFAIPDGHNRCFFSYLPLEPYLLYMFTGCEALDAEDHEAGKWKRCLED